MWLTRLRLLGVGSKPITIVVYHSICDEPDRYTITPEAFVRQLAFITANYEIIRLNEIKRALGETNRAARGVVITFDDAFENFYDNAYPILASFQVPATVFVPSGLIAKTNEWDVSNGQLPTRNLMTEDQLLSLKNGGLVDFGSHSVTHVSMRSLPIDEMKAQAVDSKRALEKLLGCPVTMFSYPYGILDDFSEDTTRVLSAAGYEIAVTTCWGTKNSAPGILALKRIYLEDSDGEAALWRKIEGDYDWKAIRQRFVYGVRTFRRILGI